MSNPIRSGWRCHCGNAALHGLCRVPPAPHVMAALFMEFKRLAPPGTSFMQYLAQIGFIDPSVDTSGMDDRLLAVPKAAGIQLLAIPPVRVTGQLRVIVLLVDFPDRPGVRTADHYNDMLFTSGVHPTGSMRDFYAEASNRNVDVTGSVHGWLRMPQPYSYYVNGESGTGNQSYPRNCKKLAEDAAKIALQQGVVFPPDLDKLGTGAVTALFIVHAGRGAETMPTVEQQKQEIWSHKWNVQKPVTVAPGLAATTYLVVPQDCRVGVCAHELGHLAFQWQDFYDPNYNDDGQYWDGSGSWDLMAGGSHNHSGTSPAHPAVLHKVQHGWVPVQKVSASGPVRLKPVAGPGGRAVMIVSPAFNSKQYLLLENRRRQGFDRHLPGEGLLVWRVDESKEMFAPAAPGMQLLEADNLQQLLSADDYNEGDDSDPFPGSGQVTELLDTGPGSTSFPGGKKSGIRLSNIREGDDGAILLDVEIAGAPKKVAPADQAMQWPVSKAKPKSDIQGVKSVAAAQYTLAGLLGEAALPVKKAAGAAKGKGKRRAPSRAGKSATAAR